MGRKTQICLYDNIVSHTSQRGIGRYFNQITNGIIAKYGLDVTVCSPIRRDYSPAIYHKTFPRKFRGSERLRVGNILLPIIDNHIAKIAEKRSAKVIFSPYYGHIPTDIPQIVTVHDMTHELFADYFPPNNPYVRNFVIQKKNALENADLLIAVSQNTAKDIQRFYPTIDPANIHVIHHGVNQFFLDAIPTANPNRRPYFLFVGVRSKYKNFLRLLSAYGQSGLAATVDLHAISPVGHSFSAEENQLIQKYNLQTRVHLKTAVSDEQLRTCYSNALAFIYPSEYEGFGFPILEAMASGTVVLISNTSSMPEVAGDCALYFDPVQVDSIMQKLIEVVGFSAETRQETIAEGKARAQQFSWEACYQKTITAIESIIR